MSDCEQSWLCTVQIHRAASLNSACTANTVCTGVQGLCEHRGCAHEVVCMMHTTSCAQPLQPGAPVHNPCCTSAQPLLHSRSTVWCTALSAQLHTSLLHESCSSDVCSLMTLCIYAICTKSSSISGILRGKPSKPIRCMGQNTMLVPRISTTTQTTGT